PTRSRCCSTSSREARRRRRRARWTAGRIPRRTRWTDARGNAGDGQESPSPQRLLSSPAPQKHQQIRQLLEREVGGRAFRHQALGVAGLLRDILRRYRDLLAVRVLQDDPVLRLLDEKAREQTAVLRLH